MKVGIEVITPAYAKQLLDQQDKNRPLGEATVVRYAADMKAGKWLTHGSGLSLTLSGRVLDGQHRLAAIVRAGVPISMVVTRGVEEEAFVVIDSGKGRTLSHVLAIEGHSNVNTIAAVARGAYAYASGASFNYSANRTELEPFVRNHPYIAEISRMVDAKMRKMQKSPLATVLFLANEERKYDSEVEEFIYGISTGSGLFSGDARLTLREWLLNYKLKANKAKLSTQAIFSATARAWNHYARAQAYAKVAPTPPPTRSTVQIVGFNQELYSDLPDLGAPVRKQWTTNIPNGAPPLNADT